MTSSDGRQQTAAVVVVALAVVAVAVAATALGTATLRPAQDGGGWTELPAPPLSPRMGSTVAWTGEEALFLGGVVGGLCPPAASCVHPERTARDGAAYDPATRSWRRTAPAPVDLPAYGAAAVVDRVAFLLVADELLRYDADRDAWAAEPGPSPADGFWSLTRAGDRLIAVRTQQREQYHPDQSYDPKTVAWTPLPRDPLVPSFGRQVTWTPHGLVLTARPEVDNPGSDLATSLTRAALLDARTGTWRRLPDSDQLDGGFTWTGSRLVAPTLGGADGGEVNGYGRTVPYGGRLDLPSGTWSRLPNAPDELDGGWPVSAVDGPRIATAGWLYDDGRGTWARLPRPDAGPLRPGAAVWAGDRLVVVGGYTPDAGYTDAGLSATAHEYLPEVAISTDG